MQAATAAETPNAPPMRSTPRQPENLPQSFQILDTQDQLSAIKRLCKQFNVDDERFPPKQMQWFIGGCKEDGLRANMVPVRDEETRKKVEIYAAV